MQYARLCERKVRVFWKRFFLSGFRCEASSNPKLFETLNGDTLNMQKKKRGIGSFLWDFNLQRALRHDDDEYDDEKNGVVVFLPQPRERERDLLLKTTFFAKKPSLRCCCCCCSSRFFPFFFCRVTSTPFLRDDDDDVSKHL